MTLFATIVVILVAVLISAAMAVSVVVVRGRSRRRMSVDDAMRQLYASYQASIGERADRVLSTSLPDDEWLAAIKAQAEFRARLRDLPDTEQDAAVTFRAVRWEVVEPSMR